MPISPYATHPWATLPECPRPWHMGFLHLPTTESVNSVPIRWRFILALLARLPQGLLSRLTGHLAAVPLPGPLRGPVLGLFARTVGMDLAEAEKPLRAYRSVSHLFTRRLRPGVRRWPNDPELPGSPVDGTVGAVGQIRSGEVIQAKGIPYRVDELLGGGEEGGASAVASLEGGFFVTLYLSPRDYHRIHIPVGGAVSWARTIPGALLPVNTPAVAAIPRLFPRNERMVAWIETGGPSEPDTSPPAALVAVGAFNVGGISALYDPAWHREAGAGRSLTNRRGRRDPETRRYDPPLNLARGEEFMAFHLGSTVVLLFGPGPEWSELHPDLRPGASIRLGDPLFR